MAWLEAVSHQTFSSLARICFAVSEDGLICSVLGGSEGEREEGEEGDEDEPGKGSPVKRKVRSLSNVTALGPTDGFVRPRRIAPKRRSLNPLRPYKSRSLTSNSRWIRCSRRRVRISTREEPWVYS